MDKKFTDFYEAWWFLNETPIFQASVEDMKKMGFSNELIALENSLNINCFHQSLQIEVQKVCPKTNRIMKNKNRNTKTVVWLESGEPYYDEGTKSIKTYHNIDYDCGGNTFEEAILNLANIVYEKNKNIIEK